MGQDKPSAVRAHQPTAVAAAVKPHEEALNGLMAARERIEQNGSARDLAAVDAYLRIMSESLAPPPGECLTSQARDDVDAALSSGGAEGLGRAVWARSGGDVRQVVGQPFLLAYELPSDPAAPDRVSYDIMSDATAPELVRLGVAMCYALLRAGLWDQTRKEDERKLPGFGMPEGKG